MCTQAVNEVAHEEIEESEEKTLQGDEEYSMVLHSKRAARK